MPTLHVPAEVITRKGQPIRVANIAVSENRVAAEASRMFRRMPPEQRAYRADRSRTRLRGLLASGLPTENGAVRRHAAILLCQGVTSL